MSGTQLRRPFPRQIGALEAIFTFVEEFLAAAGIDPRHFFDIGFITEEIFTNMVRHNSEGTGDILIDLETIDGDVRIRLTDVGVEPFDLTQVPEVDTALPLEERRVGGLGLHLVRRLADSVEYDYHGGKSIVTIVKRLEK